MYEADSDSPKLGRGPKTERKPPTTILWDGMPVHELIKHRDDIDRRLPPLSLSELNLEEQMLLQYHSTRSLQSDVIAEESIPVNQRAQVANSVAASLAKLTELQETLYTTERLKAIERILIRSLRKLPEEVAEAFLVEYRAELERISGKTG